MGCFSTEPTVAAGTRAVTTGIVRLNFDLSSSIMPGYDGGRSERSEADAGGREVDAEADIGREAGRRGLGKGGAWMMGRDSGREEMIWSSPNGLRIC